jgi:hypothetical protein
VGLAVLFGIGVWNYVGTIRLDELDTSRWELQRQLLQSGLCLAAAAGSAAVLWLRPPGSVRGLRAVELVLIGAIASVILWAGADPYIYGRLEEAAGRPLRDRTAAISWYVNFTSLRWFITLVMYGTIIPNTWRRCAAVVSVLVLSPLTLFASLAFWARPLDPAIAVQVLVGMAMWFGLAAAVVVFGSYRIEVLGRQAAEARR